MADGVIPAIPQENLRTVGRWLKVNGDAVYGAAQSPFGDEFGEWTSKNAKDLRGQKLFLASTDWRATVKPGKLFLTFFVAPRGSFELPAFQNKVLRAYRLMDKAPVTVKTENGHTNLTIDTPMPDPMATVVVVEFEGDRIVR